MQKLFLALGIIYLIIRFGLTQHLDALGTYASYTFEVICLVIALGLYGKKIFDLFKLKKPLIGFILVALVAGFLTFKGAGPLGLIIPFDFNGTEGILLLLVVAPILEEMIFRFMLWQPFKSISSHPALPWIMTTIIFSYSHFHAFWFVPAELYNFVVYQTLYTLILGLACGFAVYKYSSLAGAVLIHFAFNLGFYFGALTI